MQKCGIHDSDSFPQFLSTVIYKGYVSAHSRLHISFSSVRGPRFVAKQVSTIQLLQRSKLQVKNVAQGVTKGLLCKQTLL